MTSFAVTKPLQVGDTVVDSPVGPGKVTGINLLGYAEVNKNSVTWLTRADGVVFDSTHPKQKGTNVRS